MRKLFFILGVVLALIVAVGIFLYLQSTRPTLVDVPVAINDIPSGTPMKADLFRVVKMANVDHQTLSKWVLVGDWNKADGKTATTDVHAGFPLAKAQIDPNSNGAIETRLSAALTNPDDYYVVIPVSPQDVGNYIQPNDRIDLVVSFGAGDPKNALQLGVTPTDTVSANGGLVKEETLPVTQTIDPPISKLVIQNMQVLRVDRNPVKVSSSNTSGTQTQDTTPLGDVKLLYVKVNRDQLEVLSFILNNGRHNIAVRATNGSQQAPPTDGVTWNDFVRWFYAQRGNDANSVQPYNAISPSEPKLSAR